MSGTGEVAPSGRTLLLGAAEQSDVKRVEEEARWATVGYASTADLSQAEDQLRLEVEAADAAALQAAIDAAAASDEAGVALYEAQFGSIAVGRLLAGTITAQVSIDSPTFTVNGISITGDTGIALSVGDGGANELIWGSSVVPNRIGVTSGDHMGISAGGILYLGVNEQNGADRCPVRLPANTRVNGSTVLTYASHNHNQGWRTSSGTTWNNGDGHTGNPIEYTTHPGYHKHQVGSHTHQVYI